MDLKTGRSYFLKEKTCEVKGETTRENQEEEIVIIGAGISGALIAHELINEGLNCIIIDENKPAHGSSAASTGLLQYETDTPLHQLEKTIGKKNAVKVLNRCSQAIHKLKTLAELISFNSTTACNSVYFAHNTKSESFLEKEFKSRKRAGFEVMLLSKQDLLKNFQLNSPLAIISANAAKTDTYGFTCALLAYNIKRGLRVFTDTSITKIAYKKKKVELRLQDSKTIKTKKIIFATGYNLVHGLKQPGIKLHSTYVTGGPVKGKIPAFFKENIFWNTAQPYLYVREASGHIFIGGRDEDFYNPAKRDKLLSAKTKALTNDFKKFWPGISVTNKFSWAGTFGSSADGLPYIGTHRKFPHSYFSMAFGGNGIVYSALAAEIIASSIKKKKNTNPDFFSFERRIK